ncbi:MAG: ATP-binding protein [Mariprofundaceae bacterium]
MILAYFNLLELEYAWPAVLFMFFVAFVVGVFSYFFVFYLEQTDAVLASQQEGLEQALKQPEAANEAKSNFLSLMSHDLRTPFHGLIGMQELLAKQTQNWSAEQVECLQLSLHVPRSLKFLLNDVLDLAKIEAHGMSLEKQRFDILTLAKEALMPFVVAVKDKNIELQLKIQHVPRQFIGDELRLRQVLVNLIGNAVKFTDEGYVRLTITMNQSDAHELCFTVEDSGIGISDAAQPCIFEPFQQDYEMHDQLLGTGLGTSIVKQFPALMGGKVSLSSQLGGGSSFRCVIPL